MPNQHLFGEAFESEEIMSGAAGKVQFSNDLTDAQAERLAILLEEMGEAQQAIGKILRHGYHSWDPTTVNTTTNRDDLMKELGDVVFAINLLTSANDVDGKEIGRRCAVKSEKIKPFLHHQGETAMIEKLAAGKAETGRDIQEELRESAKLALDHPCLTNFLCELVRAYEKGCKEGADRVSALERERDRHTKALIVIAEALKGPHGGSYWPARQYLDEFDKFHEDLDGTRVLLQVAQLALKGRSDEPTKR